MSIQDRIEALGFTLPDVPSPVANYVPAVWCGNEIRTSGQIPLVNGELLFKGSIPSTQSIENGVRAAEVCALNAIAAARSLLDGDLERVTRVIQLKVYVASDTGFEGHSTVANGASDLMVSVFGDSGRSIRVAMGSNGLPLGASVEVEAVFEVN